MKVVIDTLTGNLNVVVTARMPYLPPPNEVVIWNPTEGWHTQHVGFLVNADGLVPYERIETLKNLYVEALENWVSQGHVAEA